MRSPSMPRHRARAARDAAARLSNPGLSLRQNRQNQLLFEVPLGLPEGAYTSHVLLTYVAELLGEDEDWLPTITRPPGDRVIEVIE
jgi:hypothetical protein